MHLERCNAIIIIVVTAVLKYKLHKNIFSSFHIVKSLKGLVHIVLLLSTGINNELINK